MSTSHISVDCVVVCQLRCTINNQVSENYVEDQKKKRDGNKFLCNRICS